MHKGFTRNAVKTKIDRAGQTALQNIQTFLLQLNMQTIGDGTGFCVVR